MFISLTNTNPVNVCSEICHFRGDGFFAKGQGEKERYIHLNAEFQRTARSDKNAFLSDQCKETEETIEWKILEISSRKLEIPREHFMENGHSKGQKWYGPNRSRRY